MVQDRHLRSESLSRSEPHSYNRPENKNRSQTINDANLRIPL